MNDDLSGNPFAQMVAAMLEEELRMWNEDAWKAGDRAAILIGQHVDELIHPRIVDEKG